jgi:hypothetical protein
MSSLAGWILALAVAVAATILGAVPEANQPHLHMVVTGLVGLVLAILAIRAHQRLIEGGASPSAIARSTACHLGLVWAWAGLALAGTYLLIIEARWPEWWQFVIGFAFAAAASLAFAKLLDRGAAPGQDDDPMVGFGRRLVQVQLIGMVAGIVSLFVDNKFPRGIAHPDWAGSNIFFFGALTIAAISLDALRAPRRV